MDAIQKALIKVGRKDLAQEYFKKCQSKRGLIKEARDWQKNIRLSSLGMTIEILTGDTGDEIKLSLGDRSYALRTRYMNHDEIKIRILDQIEKILKKCDSDILSAIDNLGFKKFKM